MPANDRARPQRVDDFGCVSVNGNKVAAASRRQECPNGQRFHAEAFAGDSGGGPAARSAGPFGQDDGRRLTLGGGLCRQRLMYRHIFSSHYAALGRLVQAGMAGIGYEPRRMRTVYVSSPSRLMRSTILATVHWNFVARRDLGVGAPVERAGAASTSPLTSWSSGSHARLAERREFRFGKRRKIRARPPSSGSRSCC